MTAIGLPVSGRFKMASHQRPFKCDVDGCDKAFTRKPHLQRHQQSHSGKKSFVCSEEGCSQAFTLRDNLKKHIKRVHTNKKYQIKCNFEGCGKVFTKKQGLKIHQYEHTNIKPFRCDHNGCEASFLLPSRLKRHAKQHEGYTCTQEGCTSTFDKWSLLRKHVAVDHVIEYECRECKKIFHKKYKLQVHMKSHRDAKEVFICPRENCQFSSLRVNEMDIHISNYHDGARPFACQHEGCTKTFVHKHSKIKHQIVHSPGYIKPQPKPKKKRGVSSILATYPDEGTRGPCVQHTLTQAEHVAETDSTCTSALCDNIDSVQPKTVSNQHNFETITESVEPDLPIHAAAEELPMENCCIEETGGHSNIDSGKSGAVFVLADETSICETQTVVDEGTSDTDTFLCQDQTINNVPPTSKIESGVDNMQSATKTSSSNEALSTVSLASDTETGADDLDALIKAVTKSRNSTSKETTLKTNSALKDHVMVL